MVNPIALTNRSASDRPATDFYPTPPEVTHSLLSKLALPRDTILYDPASGAGNMVQVFKERGYPYKGSDLYEYSYVDSNVTYGVDFLTVQSVPEKTFIITNPPFILAAEFIAHAIELKVPFAYLLKSQYWNAARRVSLFQNFKPRGVYPLSWRPDFNFREKKDGSPIMDVLITVWGAEPAQITEFDILRKLPSVEMSVN